MTTSSPSSGSCSSTWTWWSPTCAVGATTGYLLAYAVPTAWLWDEIRSTMAMPMRLVELRVPLERDP